MKKEIENKEIIDKETQKVMSEGRMINDFVKSDAWKLIRKRLYDKLITTDSILSLPEAKSVDQQLIDIKSRAGAVSLVLDWIKDIEGDAAKYENNRELFAKIREESIIEYFQ